MVARYFAGVSSWPGPSYSHGVLGAAWPQLFWAPVTNLAIQAGLDGTLNSFVFMGFSGAEARWQSVLPVPDGFGNPHLLQFFIDIKSGPVTFISPVTAGLNLALGAVIDDSAGANFTVNLRFEAFDTVWVPLNAISQPSGGVPLTLAEFQGGFFFVPEPSSMAVLLTGLAGVIARRRITSR